MKKSLLFTIVMALLCLFGNVKAQTTEAPGSFSCPGDAWVWAPQQSGDARWDNTNNWTAPKNGRPQHNGVGEQYPGQTRTDDKVYIPNINSRNGKYPTLDATITIAAIYLEDGAMLNNQYLLNATTWYTDITVPTNRWILVSSPLRGTYSGDFYTTTQGGTYNGPFDPSVYAATSGNEGNNRKFPYVIYERLFSNATQIRYAAYDIDGFSSTWANPTNALAYQFQPGEAVQILARGTGAAGEKETFHFPASDTEYYYYNSNGQITQKNGADWAETGLSREQSGRPVYNSSTMNLTLRRNVPAGQTPSSLWAVGNPAFASLDITEFLKVNFNNGNTGRYLYKHVAGGGSVAEAEGSEEIYYITNNGTLSTAYRVESTLPEGTLTTAEPYINSNRGFRVTTGSGKAQPTNVEKLLGEYQMTLVPHEMNWNMEINNPILVFFDRWQSRVIGTNNRPYNQSNINITLTKDPSNPNGVFISNFAGLASQTISATVDTINHRITISANTKIGDYSNMTAAGSYSGDNMILYTTTRGDNTLSVNNNTADTDVTGSSLRSNQNRAEYHILSNYANNLSKNDAITLTYSIDNDGAVTIAVDKAFAAYPSDLNHFYYGGRVYHSSNSSYTDGDFSIGEFFSSAWNCFDSYSGTKAAPTNTDSGVNQGSDEITLLFTEKMFTTSQRATSQQSPRRSAAQGSDVVSIEANYNNRSVNTILIRNEEASNGYDEVEDAAILSEFDEEKFSLGTLAGTVRVAANALNDTTRCQIVLTGVNGDVDLVFDNLDALGENVRLFDANDSTYTPLNGNHATTTVTFGVNDSPLRYSLVWDYTPIIAGNETLTAIDFTAFSPAKGEVKVMSNELLKGVRVYNAAGQLITSNNANANEVSFSNLLSGIYVIEAYTANGKATKKVDVK